MADSVGPTGSSDPTADSTYHAQYQISPEFRKFWGHLFHVHLSDKQLSEMTDQFVKNIWNGMNQVLKHALKVQKDLETKRKQDGGG